MQAIAEICQNGLTWNNAKHGPSRKRPFAIALGSARSGKPASTVIFGNWRARFALCCPGSGLDETPLIHARD
jgi:hypothetical protein